MTDEVERVVTRLVARLVHEGYSKRKETTGGMGSVRVMTNGRFVVDINNDRGTLGITIGRHPAVKDEDRYSLTHWGSCVGLRALRSGVPTDRVLSDKERAELAENDAATLQDLLKEIQSLPAQRLQEIESCARRRQEQFWRDLGLWPFPKDGAAMRMKPPQGPSAKEDTLAFREVFARDYERER